VEVDLVEDVVVDEKSLDEVAGQTKQRLPHLQEFYRTQGRHAVKCEQTNSGKRRGSHLCAGDTAAPTTTQRSN
jgi:hypothetical protein